MPEVHLHNSLKVQRAKLDLVQAIPPKLKWPGFALKS